LEILVTYDVATDDVAGRRRLRRVAKVCEGFGQRVQKSVFECVVNAAQLEVLRHRLRREIDLRADSLRIYRLVEPRTRYVYVMGREPSYNLRDPLIT
jgi:CRISPR-associated protein Cas2